MSDENRISILICKDAGTASRTLLAREDFRIRWALTDAEAESVIRFTKCAVCVTREPLAKAVLGACATADREVAPIVLLEPAQWSSWREYMIWIDPYVGATSVLQAHAADQLLDALSDATGVSFRTAPRIPFKTVVRLTSGDQSVTSTSLNLSTTGVSITDLPPHTLGSDVTLAFDLGGKPFEIGAIVSRFSRVGTRNLVGLAFQNVSSEQQAMLDEFLAAEQANLPPITEPVEEFDALDDQTVLALRTSNVQGDTLSLIRALVSGGKVERSETAAKWLIAACDAFTTHEVAAVVDPAAAPSWAQDAVLARLRAYQARSRAGMDAPAEADVREVFGLCQRLAETAAGADAVALVQVTNVRADILRALYQPELLETF